MYEAVVRGGRDSANGGVGAHGKILKGEWGEDVVLRTRQKDSGVRGI